MNDALSRYALLQLTCTDWCRGLAGLSLNGRVVYTSEAYLTTANTVTFPAWTRVDAGVRYATWLNGRPITFRANVENLFNESYWITTRTFATVGSPSTYIQSAAFDFWCFQLAAKRDALNVRLSRAGPLKGTCHR